MACFKRTKGPRVKPYRFAPVIEGVILGLSLVTAALSAAYGVQLSKAALHGPFLHGAAPWSITWTVFYNGTVPVVSIILSAIGLVLYFYGALTALFGVIVSTLLVIGWSFTLGWWLECDLAFLLDNTAPSSCYQSNVYLSGALFRGVSDGLTAMKLTFCVLSTTASILYLGFSAAALARARKAKRNDTTGRKQADADYEMY